MTLPRKSAGGRRAGAGRPRGPDYRSRKRFDTARFVAWDGEAFTSGDAQTYFYLRNSADGELRNDAGVTGPELVRFLMTEQERIGPGGCHVLFGGNYDWVMWLKALGIEPAQAERLLKGRWSWVGPRPRLVRVRYIPRKELLLWFGPGRTMKFWDVHGFYQSSFIKAVESWLGDDSPYLPILREMKPIRHTFTPAVAARVTAYTGVEVEALCALMERLRESLKAAGLKIRRWDGAGALASELLRARAIKSYKGALPQRVREAALGAYFGGRMEMLNYGLHPGLIFLQDIRSAYPAVCARLPCLAHGRWSHRKDRRLRADPLSVYLVRWDLPPARLYPFPFRTPDGSVFFPPFGRAWLWRPELIAALEAGLRFDVEESYAWLPECPHRPFAFIPELFKERMRLRRLPGAAGAAEKALKLALNSIYGKLAQGVGQPGYQNFAWSGFITSYVRARMFSVTWPLRDSLVFIATDGYALTALPAGEPGPGLGDWETESALGGIFIQSGVYRLYDECGPEGLARPMERGRKARGFSLTHAAEESLGEIALQAWREGKASVVLDAPRFTTLGMALASWATFSARLGTWAGKRTLVLEPQRGGKRASAETWGPERAASGLMDTRPAFPFPAFDPAMLSSPHVPKADKTAILDAEGGLE